MKMKVVSSPEVREPKPQTWSNCKVYGNHAYISGMTAHDLEGIVVGDGSMYDQTKRTFQKIKHLVEAAGGTMNDIIAKAVVQQRLVMSVTSVATMMRRERTPKARIRVSSSNARGPGTASPCCMVSCSS